MSDLDNAIRQALSADDKRALEAFAGEQSLLDQVTATLGGEFRFLNIAGWLGGFALFAAGAMTAFRFVQAPDLRGMLLWGGATAIAFAGLALVKVWFWLELQRNATVREIKRLELQVARLTARLPG